MMRLLVEARTAEWTSGGDVPLELLVGVSVSRADDGSPVTGLSIGNFRIAAQVRGSLGFRGRRGARVVVGAW